MPEQKLTSTEKYLQEIDALAVGQTPIQEFRFTRPILKVFIRKIQNETLEAAEGTAEFFPTICERCSGNGEVGHGESELIECPKCEGCGHKFHHEIPDLIAAQIHRLIQKEGEPKMTEPTKPADIESPLFKAIWEAIKHWDVETKKGEGYHGVTATDVMVIVEAVRSCSQPERRRT